MRRAFSASFVFLLVAAAAAGQSSLESQLLATMRAAQFDATIDYGPYNEACPGKSFCPFPALTIAHMPNVDVAIIRLDSAGHMTDRANVMLSRDYPNGLVVPLDPNGGATSVRFIRWDIARWDGGTFSDSNGKQLTVKGWIDNPDLTPDDDIVPGRASAPFHFMAPYPASLFKLMIAYRVMRLVDMGVTTLDTPYTYSPDKNDKKKDETRAVRDWMDPMITYSDNHSARALVKMLWDLNQIDAMNAEFRDLGLGTLQVNATNPATGGNWLPGQLHMTAYDTARLLWIIAADEGFALWNRPNGVPVTAAELSATSRAYLKSLLADQGFNEALTTSNFCGAANVTPGIPSRVPLRWIGADGTVTVGGVNYGSDVRPCATSAKVTFAHKTGLTFNYGADAGIVESLPGQPSRRYIIAFLANLGYRYTDPVFATRMTLPCNDPVGPICYTQRIPALGKANDDALTP
jgi:hypothetical protein